LKRGINDLGFSANQVETEQILQVHSNSALSDQQPILSSYVQLRASFPFFWSQTPSSLTPKPDIIIDKVKDPRYLCTKKHFARLFSKYSRNIICLNLTKKNNLRESPLSREFDHFVNRVLNKNMPAQLRTIYIHFDVKANDKARKKLRDEQIIEMIKNGQPVFPFNFLDVAAKAIERTNFFSCKPIPNVSMCRVEIQRGVVRTNCIDSLDRTNFAQTMIGFKVLLRQLSKLGVTYGVPPTNLKSTLFNSLLNMYNLMGDLISVQYGGSIAHHAQMPKQSKFLMKQIPELITSVKRHYNNNFKDPLRQSMINLFLGVYQPNRTYVTLNGTRELTCLQRLQDYPTLERMLHQAARVNERQGFSSDIDVESQYWWEPCFTAFEERLPLALRYTYKYFDVVVPRNPFDEEGFVTERNDSDHDNMTLCSSPRLKSKYSYATSALRGGHVVGLVAQSLPETESFDTVSVSNFSAKDQNF